MFTEKKLNEISDKTERSPWKIPQVSCVRDGGLKNFSINCHKTPEIKIYETTVVSWHTEEKLKHIQALRLLSPLLV
jgi:hypothetical protein